MRSNRPQRQSEVLDANGFEAGQGYRVLCVPGRMTSVCQAKPKRLDGVLNTAEDGSSFRRHVLHKDELASWPQNAPDLLESFALVVTEHSTAVEITTSAD